MIAGADHEVVVGGCGRQCGKTGRRYPQGSRTLPPTSDADLCAAFLSHHVHTAKCHAHNACGKPVVSGFLHLAGAFDVQARHVWLRGVLQRGHRRRYVMPPTTARPFPPSFVPKSAADDQSPGGFLFLSVIVPERTACRDLAGMRAAGTWPKAKRQTHKSRQMSLPQWTNNLGWACARHFDVSWYHQRSSWRPVGREQSMGGCSSPDLRHHGLWRLMPSHVHVLIPAHFSCLARRSRGVFFPPTSACERVQALPHLCGLLWNPAKRRLRCVLFRHRLQHHLADGIRAATSRPVQSGRSMRTGD